MSFICCFTSKLNNTFCKLHGDLLTKFSQTGVFSSTTAITKRVLSGLDGLENCKYR